MRIQMTQKELEAGASVVSSLVDRSAGSMAVLSNILIDASETGVQLRATDRETLVTVNLNATVERPGVTTVPADRFRDLVKLLPPQGEVILEESGNNVHVQCETNDYNLMSLPPDEFPTWQAPPSSTRFQISQKTLAALIDATIYALPAKDHRRVLLGVFFELMDHSLRLTATDGKKLARMSAPVPEVEGSGEVALVIPRKVLENAHKFLGNEGPVEVEFSDPQASNAHQVSFRFGNVLYRSNGIEGKYPDCDSVIPKEFTQEILFNRDLFLQATRRAGVVAVGEKSKSILLKFADNACSFSSMAHDLGTFSGKMPLDYDAAPMEMAFNFEYLLETLMHFPTNDLRMLIKTPRSPVVIRSRDEQDTRLALLMPIKLADIRPVSDEDSAGEES